jgi:hypothetical protein
MSSQKQNQCEARKFGDCYLCVIEYDIIFKYRDDSTGRRQPDELVKVSMCQTHYNWLSNINQGKPLSMQGQEPADALHDDLFAPLADKAKMFTLMKVEFLEKTEEHHHLFSGRNVDDMRTIIKTFYPSEVNVMIYEEGFFQTASHCNEDTNDCDEVVIEVNHITSELGLEALANGIAYMNVMTPRCKRVDVSPHAFAVVSRAETEPIYVKEPFPELFKRFFKSKQVKETYTDFTECVQFIEDHIDYSIIDWTKMREKSPHTEQGLFDTVQLLTKALEGEDSSIIAKMRDDALITPDVLWITYIRANHRLFASKDPKKDLTKSKKLVDLFVFYGLEKDLLTLAICGERERELFNKRRAHYNILHENEFVVEYLVPQYVSHDQILYTPEESIGLEKSTPLEIWHKYDNTTNHFGGGYCFWGGDNIETFEKNERIRSYLESQIPV